MIELTKEIEVFYERNRNGYYFEEDGTERIGWTEYANEIGNIFGAINHDLKYLGFIKIFDETHDNINSVSRKEYFRENEYSHEFDIHIEVNIRLTELTTDVVMRLKTYGYDQKKAEEEEYGSNERLYWNLRGSLFNDKIEYYIPLRTISDEIEKEAEQLIGETTKNYEIFLLLKNDGYREWLKNRIDHPEDIIIYAPLEIQKKRELLHKLKFVHSFSDGCGSYDLSTSPVSMFVLHEKMRANENGIRNISERVTIHRTYSEVLDTIKEKYSEKEPDEFDHCWNIVERFDLRNGEYCKTGIYLVSEKGNIWNAYDPADLIEGNVPKQLCHTSFVLPAPFKSGDILTIDCRPFREVCHAVVIVSENDSGVDDDGVRTPYCLWIQDSKLILDEFCCICDGLESFSPFYKLKRIESELTANERILDEVSKWIKTRNEDEAKIYAELRKIANSGNNWEEELHKLLNHSEK